MCFNIVCTFIYVRIGGRIVKEYEINSSTLCIYPIDKDRSYVYELDDQFEVDMSCFDIINKSCLFFGSSYTGRRNGSTSLLNSTHKVPILIEESTEIIFFPTASVNNINCIWISYNNLESIKKIDKNYSDVLFKQNREFKMKISYFILTNQVIRAKRLKSEFNIRKKAF